MDRGGGCPPSPCSGPPVISWLATVTDLMLRDMMGLLPFAMNPALEIQLSK